jgi:methylmalonyl-CoA mutase
MAPPSEPLVLAGEFPPADRDQWRALVDGVLKGRPFEKVLVNRLHDGIELQPLYTADDVSVGDAALGLPGAAPFVRGAEPAATGWDVRQHHVVVDAPSANAAMLTDLERGATSLWVRSEPGLLAAALDGVYLDLAGVVLDAGPAFAEAAAALEQLWSEQGVPLTAVSGGFGADPIAYGAAIDPAVDLAVSGAARHPRFRAITVDGTVWHDAGGSDVDELAITLAAGVAYLRALTARGLPLAEAASQIEFRLAATADQFATIAKFRAARRLWARVTELSGGVQPQAQHAVTSAAMMTARDPWVNMLRTTVACFGAAVGGADAITVRPFDHAIGQSDSFSRRVARNTQAILLDESNLSRVTDPGGGSWFVEHLSDEMANVAWTSFRDIERAGGIVAALDSGMVRERLDAAWNERLSAIARRKDPITGVSEFPDIAEVPVVRPPAPAAPDAVVPRRRYAEGFERLRDRADAADERPTVFLANLGPVAVHTARATFAKNFFEAGGIATIGNDGFESPVEVEGAFGDSGATIACICSSDAVYDERADATAVALRTAGARRVYLAGRRATDGVDDLIYVGCDALTVLESALDAVLGESAGDQKRSER